MKITARATLVALVLSLCHTSFVFADESAEAEEAYKRGDYAEAAKWFRKAAEEGDAVAQYNLGNMYSDGKGVPQDDAEALKWCRRAAEQGQADAQYSIGLLYAYGGLLDYAEAYMWFSLAAANGTEELRDRAFEDIDFVASMMSTASIAEAQRQFFEWKPRKE